MVRHKKTGSEAHYDQTASKYESLYRHPYWQFYLEVTWKNIKRYLPSNRNSLILDAGGGTGYFSRKLAKLGYRVVCTDISQGMLDEGRRIVRGMPFASKIDFVRSDITKMKEFPDNHFGLVLAEGDPVAYCGNPKKAISELTRVAKKGAFVIVSVDGFYATLRRMCQKQDFRGLKRLLETGDSFFADINSDQHNFTVEELKDLFVKSNLEVIDVIGKTVFAEMISEEKKKALDNQKVRDQILRLEQKFNNAPSLVGCASHLEIVGRKK